MKVARIHPRAIVPYKKDGNIGFDLSIVENIHLMPWQKAILPTGLKIEIPEGYAVIFRDRSGLSAKHGIHILAGVIDSSYRGEWKIAVINLSDSQYVIESGDRIAQGILIKDELHSYKNRGNPRLNWPRFTEVSEEELSQTSREEKGFGSSGR